MKLDIRIVLGLAVLALIIGGTLILDINRKDDDYIVSGYDGIIGEIVDVDTGANGGEVINTGTTASFDPPMRITWAGGRNPSRVICEITAAVNVLANETDEPDGGFVPFDKWLNTTKTVDDKIVYTYEHVQVHRYSCLMGVTVRTDYYQTGSHGILDTVYFTVRLSENDFSVFEQANETYASIIQIYLRGTPTITGIGSIIPALGGGSFDVTPISTEQPPMWLSQAGYNVYSMAKLHVVEFTFAITNLSPTQFLFWTYNSQIDFLVGIDVVLAGQWKVTTNKPIEFPDNPGPFDWLFALGASILSGLQSIGWSTIWPIAVIVVVFLILYLILLRRHG